ncbi:MFS transporter [Acinetobacter seifertii]|nr:MFS transporter [Acinetobacter seifertii]
MSTPEDISQNKPLLWLMAASMWLMCRWNYYCQPLIHSIQQEFAVTQAQAALTVTFAQVSYALGLLFIVPMGDIVNKAKAIPFLMVLCAVGLFTSAFAVNLPMLWIGTILAGLFSVAAQVLIPLATMTVKPEKTGEIIGFLMSGLLVGILLSTSLAGLFPIFSLESRLCSKRYINAAIGIYFKKSPALCIAYENELWANLCFYGSAFKAREATIIKSAYWCLRICSSQYFVFHYRTTTHLCTPFARSIIGLVPLVGIFGALSTRYIGKYADQGYTKLLTWMGCGLFLVSWICFYFGQTLLFAYVIGFALIQLALALVHTSNQSIFSVYVQMLNLVLMLFI